MLPPPRNCYQNKTIRRRGIGSLQDLFIATSEPESGSHRYSSSHLFLIGNYYCCLILGHAQLFTHVRQGVSYMCDIQISFVLFRARKFEPKQYRVLESTVAAYYCPTTRCAVPLTALVLSVPGRTGWALLRRAWRARTLKY